MHSHCGPCPPDVRGFLISEPHTPYTLCPGPVTSAHLIPSFAASLFPALPFLMWTLSLSLLSTQCCPKAVWAGSEGEEGRGKGLHPTPHAWSTYQAP